MFQYPSRSGAEVRIRQIEKKIQLRKNRIERKKRLWQKELKHIEEEIEQCHEERAQLLRELQKYPPKWTMHQMKYLIS